MSDLPPANWYPDPEVPGQQRYWDGTQWTEHRAPGAGAQPPQDAGQAGPQDAGSPSSSWEQPPGSAAPQWGQPQQQPAQQQPWGASGQTWGQGQGYAQPASGSTNGMAITSLVVAIVSFFLAFIVVGAIGGIVAVVLGVLALRKIKESGGAQGGRGLAIGGIVVGGISILLGIVLFAIFAFVGTAIEQGSTGFTDFFECIEEEARTGEDLNC